ncbi:hypothetical protein VM1G_10813 [Cytospora mali]|uniref:PD-(D/E)XK nuclease-like domain-containing protein n=1 Tax=Cytospora mali TaxID=578113 RepID=A0A194VJG7_CYTMA|nr:hypothetical protein VM1G_10813 [Valsa mali]
MILDPNPESLFHAQPQTRTQVRIVDWLSDLPLPSPPRPSLYPGALVEVNSDKKRKRPHDLGPLGSDVQRQYQHFLLPPTSPPASQTHFHSQASTPPSTSPLLHGSIMTGTHPSPSPPPPQSLPPPRVSKRRRMPAGQALAVSSFQDSDDELNIPQPVFTGGAAPNKDGMENNIDNTDLTPRPSRSRSWREADCQSRTTTTTTTSGASSPRKRLHALRIDAGGLEVRPLTTTARHMPPPLKKLNGDMELAGSGYGVVDPTVFRVPGQKLPSASVLPSWAFAPDPVVRVRLGPTPSLDQVRAIVSDAAHAQHLGYLESGWNCTVHAPLLKLALDIGCLDAEDDDDDDDQPQQQQQHKGLALGYDSSTSRITPLGVDFMPCTTAKIIKEYIPTPAPAKMVDFAMVLGMANLSPRDKRRIEQLCAGVPLASINHTDFAPLMSNPIAVSIETKKPGKSGGDNDAQLQVGVWQASQWRQLQDLVRRAAALRPHDDGENDNDNDEDEDDSAWPESAMSSLPLLPAVIVSGHDWSFAASTREGPKTILWSDTCFGTTRTVRGVYSIIIGLQRLAEWVRAVFLP